MQKHFKYIPTLIVLVFYSFLVTAQEKPLKHLQGFFSSDLHLHSDTSYLISYNIKIGSEAMMYVASGTEIIFNSGASITVDGGLNMEGSHTNKVLLKSKNENFQGIGIIITGKEGKNINLQYTVFDGLLIPLTFQNNWYRENVNITNNIFKHTYTEQAAIKINRLNQLKLDTICNFNFSQNNFIENSASIDLGYFEDDILKLKFENNLINSNLSFGFNTDNPERSSTHVRYNSEGLKHKHSIKNNAFFGNYHINGFKDEDVKEVNFGVQGAATDINLGENYFGSPSVTMQERFIHFFQNNQFPIVNYQQIGKPNSKIHAHSYKQTDNNNNVIANNQALDFSNNEFTLYFNRVVSFSSSIDSVEFVQYDSLISDIIITKIPITGKLSNDSLSFVFKFPTLDFETNKGCIITPTFIDSEGFKTPRLVLGKTLLIDLFSHDSFGQFSEITETQNNLNSILSTNNLNKQENKKKPKTFLFDAGLFFGKTAYRGELTMDGMPYASGMFYRMTINENTSFKASMNYGKVNGSSQGATFWKNLSFSSEIIELSLQTEINLVNFDQKKIVPSLFFGISVFQFNPKASITDSLNGYNYTYNLQPLNTEQLDEPYKLTQLSIPFGVGIKKIMLKKWVVGLEIGVRKTFTDYLDDVSGFYAEYDNFEDPIAAHFSDPSRVITNDNNEEIYNYQKPGLRGDPYNKDWYIFMGLNISSLIK
tara:strand:+ start:821 stop:2944 length:2124 start_codon:yes stop_codon:yes gene_type:complete